MKKWIGLFLVCTFLCTGCGQTPPAETAVSDHIVPSEISRWGIPGTSESARMLGKIWETYAPQERFSIYGGSMEQPVANAPGDLDMEVLTSWANMFHLPLAWGNYLDQGASMTHLLNGNLFSAGIFRMTEGKKPEELGRDWRWELQNSQWVSGRPARLLLVRLTPKHLLVAFGSREYVQLFREKLLGSYPNGKVLFEEPITA